MIMLATFEKLGMKHARVPSFLRGRFSFAKGFSYSHTSSALSEKKTENEFAGVGCRLIFSKSHAV